MIGLLYCGKMWLECLAKNKFELLRLVFYIHKSRLSNMGILWEQPAVSDCTPQQKHNLSVRENTPSYLQN